MRSLRYWSVFLISLVITGCASNNVDVYDRNPAVDAAARYAIKKVVGQHTNQPFDEIAFEALINVLAKETEKFWGDRKIASRSEYVKYSNRYKTRVFVDFERGRVHVETLDQGDLRNAIIRVLLTPEDQKNVDVFSARDVVFGEEPMLYKQVLDHDGQPIRWEWRAGRYADYLIENQSFRRRTDRGQVVGVDFELTKNYMEQRQYQYASIVQTHAQKYRIDESLIYAVMRTESHFNPYAVSPSNAYGLMQIIPSTAGKDVFQRIKKRSGQPTREYLFQPWNNIDTGTAYLHILETVYLKDIRDPLSKRYAIISAYNGGAGNVMKTFHSDRKRAVDAINKLSPSQVYWALTKKHPRDESRRYLEKVTTAEKDFRNGNA
ncbi:membrane-bound lytic murein transglycosylase MltC [Parendozoicomonas haliclonae]|uniref:Membrane-bound lytic murein transglycosylase C n=1 Tax=Parendozoicomonas haliclonae TaxID=1960125 RepID=A0A1X7ASB4_9GAMM|nr:membrane-bound lytic murein transglycosylase MltC [Parendozoicomonas haliclonae]SMA50960.1 Membrane-bound lytic murein transglycosylase C precursor [Parendozoicomonas haliclonae]